MKITLASETCRIGDVYIGLDDCVQVVGLTPCRVQVRRFPVIEVQVHALTGAGGNAADPEWLAANPAQDFRAGETFLVTPSKFRTTSGESVTSLAYKGSAWFRPYV